MRSSKGDKVPRKKKLSALGSKTTKARKQKAKKQSMKVGKTKN